MLHQAIDILPKESKAYEKLLDVYLEDAVFSSKEESAYLKTIHQNWDKVKKEMAMETCLMKLERHIGITMNMMI